MLQNGLAFTLLVAAFAVLIFSKVDTAKVHSEKQNVSETGDLNIRYYVTTNEADFEHSRSECTRQGGDLALPKTSQKKRDLEDYLNGIGSDGNDYWIGGVCNVNTKRYIWVDGSNIDATLWGGVSCQYDNERTTVFLETLKLRLFGGIRNTPRRAICERISI